jgi:hypothetical protein
MGFANPAAQGVTFGNFNAKEGVFIVKNAAGEKQRFSQVRDITLKSVTTKQDAYEGKERTIMQLRAANGDGDIVLSFNMAAGVTSKLLLLLDAADFGQPLGISSQVHKAGTQPKWMSEPLNNDMIVMSVYQSGAYVKSDVKLPDVPKVKVGNKEVADTSAREAFAAELFSRLQTRLGSGTNAAPEHNEPPHGNPEDLDDDNIPF